MELQRGSVLTELLDVLVRQKLQVAGRGIPAPKAARLSSDVTEEEPGESHSSDLGKRFDEVKQVVALEPFRQILR